MYKKLICPKCQAVTAEYCWTSLDPEKRAWYECKKCGLAGDPGPDQETAKENWKKATAPYCQICGDLLGRIPHLTKTGVCSWKCWADLYGEP